MFDHKTKLLEQLHSLPNNLSVLTSTEVASTMAVLRTIESLVAGAVTTLAQRAGELQTTGTGDPVIDVLQANGKISARQARIQAARASLARDLPTVGTTLTTGQAPPENIDIINNTIRNLSNNEKEEFLAADTELAEQAATMSPGCFRKATTLRVRQIRAAAGANVAAQNMAASYARTGFDTEQGMQTLYASFDPTRGAEINQALAWKTRSIAQRDGTKGDGTKGDQPLEINDNLCAQALYELIVDGVSYHDNGGSSRSASSGHPGGSDGLARSGGLASGVHRIPSVSLITDLRTFESGPHAETISETWAGVPLPPQTMARLCCDARITEVVIGPGGEPLDVGREYRSATDAQRKMLRGLYEGCAITGDSFDWCEMHHVQFWEDEGPTDLNNLVPINRYWHHLVHEGGWELTMSADRTLRLRRPDKSLYKVIRPPGPLPPTWSTSPQTDAGINADLDVDVDVDINADLDVDVENIADPISMAGNPMSKRVVP